MSAVYIRRIKEISDEFVAANGSLAYVARRWQADAIYHAAELELVGPQDIKRAIGDLETTFVIRLFAAFEGMLKEHMAQHHPRIAVPEDVRAVWLIDRAATLQTPHIGLSLRQNVHEVRRYRNTLVHAAAAAVTPLSLQEVRSRLNTYLANLPEPFT